MKKVILISLISSSFLLSGELEDFLFSDQQVVESVYTEEMILNPNSELGVRIDTIGELLDYVAFQNNIKKNQLIKFIKLNFWGLISSKIKSEIIFKDYMEKGKKHVETKQEVEKILDNVFSSKNKYVKKFLVQPDSTVFTSVLKDSINIYKQFKQNLQPETIILIENRIQEELNEIK